MPAVLSPSLAADLLVPLVACGGFAVLLYVLLVWDATRPYSYSASDGQIGLKVVLYTFLLLGILVAAEGLNGVFHFFVTLNDASRLKSGIAGAATGGGTLLLLGLFVLPRTNWKVFPKSTRAALGAAALTSGFTVIAAIHDTLVRVLTSAPWEQTSGSMTRVVAFGPITFVSFVLLGKLSQWSGIESYATVARQLVTPVADHAPPSAAAAGIPTTGHPAVVYPSVSVSAAPTVAQPVSGSQVAQAEHAGHAVLPPPHRAATGGRARSPG